jgi:hypothetical protein
LVPILGFTRAIIRNEIPSIKNKTFSIDLKTETLGASFSNKLDDANFF